MKRFFDKTTKTSFRNSSKPSFIKFGKGSDNDTDLNIKAGGLKLSGQVLSITPASCLMLRYEI